MSQRVATNSPSWPHTVERRLAALEQRVGSNTGEAPGAGGSPKPASVGSTPTSPANPAAAQPETADVCLGCVYENAHGTQSPCWDCAASEPKVGKAPAAGTEMRPLWCKEPCWDCGTEGYATRTQPRAKSEPYYCEVCETARKCAADEDDTRAVLARVRERVWQVPTNCGHTAKGAIKDVLAILDEMEAGR
jgi:hypothetical protein